MTTAPAAPAKDIERIHTIPDELKAIPRWVAYRLEWNAKRGKWEKIPIDANTGRNAKVNDSSTWADFETAITYAEDNDGIHGAGIVLADDDDLVGVDLDDCVGDELIEPWAAEIIEQLGSYSEISPSGKGLRIFIRGQLPEGGRKKGKVEMYESGRFLTVTGNHISTTPQRIETNPNALEALHGDIFDNPTQTIDDTPKTPHRSSHGPDDAELLELMFKSKNGQHLQSLWAGNLNGYSDDHSAADIALCNALAFFTVKDAARMDAIFRQSGLYRPKWDKRHYSDGRTYGQATIDKAIADCRETYSGPSSYPTITANGAGIDDFSQARRIEEDELRRYGRNDFGNAMATYQMHGHRFAFTDEWGWLYWTGTHWERRTAEAKARIAVRETLRARVNAAMTDEDTDGALIKAATPNTSKINAAASQFRDMVTTLATNFDNEPHLLNVANGVVDLRNGQLVAHEASNRFSYCVPTEYQPDAPAKEWESALGDIFENDWDLIAYLRRALGYSISGETREECMFYFFGKGGRNGKGTIVNTIAEILGHPVAQAISFDVFDGDSRGDVQNFRLAPLHNARFVAASEGKRAKYLNEAKVKHVTGRDAVQVAFKGQTPFTMTPRFKVLLMTNHPVRGDVDDDAFWYRLRVIEFKKSFKGHENKHLKDALLQPASRTGILAWLVLGAQRWYSQGMGEPAKVWEAAQRHRDEFDDAMRFMADCLEETDNDKSSWAQWSAVYDAYKEWAADNGIRLPWSKKALSSKLAPKGVEVDRISNGAAKYYATIGYKLKETGT